MYAGDSFFTLDAVGQAGLVALSAVLAWICLVLVWRWRPDAGLVFRCLLALVLFYLFVWLTPQVYYLYYVALLENLPFQNVVQEPPSPTDVGKLLAFRDKPSLSAHAKGLLGWTLILAALLRVWRSRRAP